MLHVLYIIINISCLRKRIENFMVNRLNTISCYWVRKQDNTFSLLTIKNLREWYFLTKTNLKIVYNCILVHFDRIR